MAQLLLGFDVGGSSIKAGVADVQAGVLTSELISAPTPRPSTPQAIMAMARELAQRLPSSGPIGLGYPGVVKQRRVRTAANIDTAWLGVDAFALVEQALGRPAYVLNDADAAGLAEMSWGAGRGAAGLVIVLTFGTGIGSAIFMDGGLVPNSEFGHVEWQGTDAEYVASARVRTELKLDLPSWVERVNGYLDYMNRLFWPDLFILGGGVSERYAEFAPLLKCDVEVKPAEFGAQAGVAGAALAAKRLVASG
jgi:polyphosphate glucokinase